MPEKVKSRRRFITSFVVLLVCSLAFISTANGIIIYEANEYNVTVVSDGYDSVYWNDGDSGGPDVAVDTTGGVHVVWHDGTSGEWGADWEIMYAKHTVAAGWSNATVISDGYQGSWWNDGPSFSPAIAINGSEVIHIVWHDMTAGEWGSDYEIMYTNYTTAAGWSNATVISDDASKWNTGNSVTPDIAVDVSGAVHVVWRDETAGAWGSDSEIMYAKYESGVGWTNPAVISDGYSGSYWNDGSSVYPAISVSNTSVIHVVWCDDTNATSEWGIDSEIMYINYTVGDGWSNATVISDGYNGSFWNNDESSYPTIAVDVNNGVHVAWGDRTDGEWGTEPEIMYAKHTVAAGWSNATVISDSAGMSEMPSICAGTDSSIHVAWADISFSDFEILYTVFTPSQGWSEITLISDDESSWNTGGSRFPSIATGEADAIHIVWDDETPGAWGSDKEIMYFTNDPPNGAQIPGFTFLLSLASLLLLGAITLLFKKSREYQHIFK